jgi:hypothetical protein
LSLRLIFPKSQREKPLQGNDFDHRGDFAAWYARGASKVKDTDMALFAAFNEGVLLSTEIDADATLAGS